jgi:hypothetical protein
MKNRRPPTLLLTAKQTNKHHMKKSKTNKREKSGTRRESVSYVIIHFQNTPTPQNKLYFNFNQFPKYPFHF